LSGRRHSKRDEEGIQKARKKGKPEKEHRRRRLARTPSPSPSTSPDQVSSAFPSCNYIHVVTVHRQF